MNNRWFFAIIVFGFVVVGIYFFMRESHVQTLRVYNSFSDFNRIGEAVRAQEFIASRLANIKFVPTAPIKILDVLGAVRDHAIDAAITSLYYWGEQDPCFYLLSANPFIYDEFQQINFINSDQGKQLYDQIGKRHNIVIFPCVITGIQVCGWWRVVPKKLQDLKGVKMRFTGMAAEIFKRLGALPRQDIEIDQLNHALQKRVIDVVEWTTPSDDLRQEFYKYAPHAMLPGWHEPGTVLHFVINRDAWNSLTTKQQEDIKSACEYSFIRLAALYHSRDGHALKELQDKGAQFHQWPQSFLREFYRIYQELIAQYCKKDKLFNELYHLIASETRVFSYYQMMQQQPLSRFISTMLPQS